MENQRRKTKQTRRRTVLIASGALLLVGLLIAILPALTGITWNNSTAQPTLTDPIWRYHGGILRRGQVYWMPVIGTPPTVFYKAPLGSNTPKELYRLEQRDGMVLQVIATDREILALTGPYLSSMDRYKAERQRDAFDYQGKRTSVSYYRLCPNHPRRCRPGKSE